MKKKTWVMFVLICLLGTSGVMASDYEKNIVNVTAAGEVSFKPNIAFLTIGVEEVYKNAGLGQTEVNRKVADFVREIKKIVEEKNIETSTIKIRKKYEYINRKREFSGYEVKQILKITIVDFENIGLIMDKGLSNGFNVISTLTFSHTEQAKFKRNALKLALLEAEKKGRLIGKTLGLKGLKVSRVVEGQSSFRPYSQKNEGMVRALSAVADSQPTKVFAGDLKAVSTVSIDYSYSGIINKR